jgi:pyrroline-5-carboxylate reductase
MRIAFIGGGVMAEAMMSGVIRNGLASPGEITVFDVAPHRLDHLSQSLGVIGCPDGPTAAHGSSVVILAVKPQHMGEATASLRGNLDPAQLVMSIAAGVTLGTLSGRLDHGPVVRVMPNTPARIGQGISGWTCTDQVTDEQQSWTRSILTALGPEIFVADERQLDMVTAVSGSGPAYVFLIIEAMIDAAVELGLSRPVAARLVNQTVLGSAAFAAETGTHPAELRNMVTSPGGTTAAALAHLERAGLRAALADAIGAAYRRAQELGD